jgi:uncharacterized membrane protein YgdD (TMEM256/DUF423 family)
MARLFFFLGSVFAGLAVVMGAWGAHSEMFSEVQMLWIDKGVRYQMFHSIALICTALLIGSHRNMPKLAVAAGGCFVGGIVLFSGSLFWMAVSSTDLGLITPAGGILFLLGWLCLAFSAPGRK